MATDQPHQTAVPIEPPPDPTQRFYDHAVPGLMEYGIHLLKECYSPKPRKSCFLLPSRPRSSIPEYDNFCVSPIHVLAGWGAVSIAADDKSRKTVESMLSKVLKDKDTNNALKTILKLVSPPFIRLYIETQFAIPLLESNIEELDKHYLGERTEIRTSVHRPLCFSCDDHGFATKHKIDADITLASEGRITSVVPLSERPNRLAHACAVSATYVNFDFPISANATYSESNFSDSTDPAKRKEIKVQSYTDEAIYRCLVTDEYDLIVLPNTERTKSCYIIRPKSTDKSIKEWIRSTSVSTFNRILDEGNEKMVQIRIPLFFSSSPHNLFNVSSQSGAKYELSRLFDREKCKMNKLFYQCGESLCTLPLWDHYHKVEMMLTVNKKHAVLPEPRIAAGNDTEVIRLTGLKYVMVEESVVTSDKSEKKLNNLLIQSKKDEMKLDENAIPGDLPDTAINVDTPFIYIIKNVYNLPLCIGVFTGADTP